MKPFSCDCRRTLSVAVLASFVCLALAFNVLAQSWPSHPVKIVVPYPAGGGTDLRARMIAEHLSQSFGQQFVVENRPGGTGIVGAMQVVRAKPDGYTLLCGYVGDLALNTAVVASLPYDPVKDFAPIAGVSTAHLVLVSTAGAPLSSVQELIQRAKAAPGTLSYASWGQGSLSHLAMAWFAKLAGIELVQVAYKGTGQSLPDIVAGHVPLGFEGPHNIESHVKAGKLRPLLVAGPKRNPIFPDVPAAAEIGMPELEISGWVGIVAPAGTPPAVVARLNTEINKALATPDLQDRFVRTGGQVMSGTANQFGAFLRSEGLRLRKVVKDIGFTPES